GLVEHNDAAVLGLGRQGMLKRERAHLLRQIDGVAARGWSERTAATAEEVHLRRAVAGGAGALLLVHLLAGAVDLGAVLDVVGAALALGKLPDDAALQNVGARHEAEDRVQKLDRTRCLAVKRHNLEFHVTRSPAWAFPWAARLRRSRPRPAGETCRAWARRPRAASSSPRRAR